MLYLALFFICFLADYYKKRSKLGFYLLAGIVYIILCFGYMTGSDWRNYELLWTGEDYSENIATNEYGFIILMKLFHYVTNDFWIFSAVMKILYFYSVLLFLKQFTNREWIAFAISFEFSTLFMLIDCPMRFMIALSLFLYAIVAYYKKKRGLFLVLSGVAITFHLTIIIVELVWLTRPLAKYFMKLNQKWALIFFVIVIFIVQSASVYTDVLEMSYRYMNFSKYEHSYGADVIVGSVLYLGMLTRIFFLCITIYLKDFIVKNMGERGAEIFYFSCLTAYLGVFYGGIPTAHRLNYLNTMYTVIVICLFITNNNFAKRIKLAGKKKIDKITNNATLVKYVVIVLFSFLILKNTNSWVYTPYSNSIPYIITGHLPYNYRYNYNLPPGGIIRE